MSASDLVIVLAGWVVPRPIRAEWRREWWAELAGRRAELRRAGRFGREARLDLFGRSLGSLRDGAGLRLAAIGQAWRVRPAGCLAAIGFLGIAGGLLGAGFRTGRVLVAGAVPSVVADWRIALVLLVIGLGFLGSAARAARWSLGTQSSALIAPVIGMGFGLGLATASLLAVRAGLSLDRIDGLFQAGLGIVSGVMLELGPSDRRRP